MENLQQTIIDTSVKLFIQYGIKQVTMDDISRACGISKKTVYSQYENKADVVDTLVNRELDKSLKYYEQNSKESKNAIEETINLLQHFEQRCKKFNARMLNDLQKYYYESWLKIDAFKQKLWEEIIIDNLQRGRNEGLYSNEFDKGIIAHMRLQQLASIHQSAMQFLTLHEALYQVTIHYLKGIATPKGLDLIEKLKIK